MQQVQNTLLEQREDDIVIYNEEYRTRNGRKTDDRHACMERRAVDDIRRMADELWFIKMDQGGLLREIKRTNRILEDIFAKMCEVPKVPEDHRSSVTCVTTDTTAGYTDPFIDDIIDIRDVSCSGFSSGTYDIDRGFDGRI